MAVGDEPAEEVNEEVVGAAVAGMFDLADVLEFINDARDESTLAQEQFGAIRQDLCAHVLTACSDEDEALGEQELLGQRGGEVATVAKQLAEEAADEPGNRSAIIDVARRQAQGQQLAAIIDDQVELEPIEPVHRGLAATRIHPEDAMLGDARIVADRERGGIDEADPAALAELGVPIDRQGQPDTRHEGDKARVADQLTRCGNSARSWVWTYWV